MTRRRAWSSKQFVAGAALVSVVVWPFPAAAQPTMAQDPIVTEATDGESATTTARNQSTSESVYIRRWRPEIFLGWASAWLGPSRIDLGPAWSNLNGGIGLRLNRWFGVEFEVGHSLDEALREVPPPVSSGAGAAQLRQGVTSATFASTKALFYLPTTRVQPYFGLGIGMVREKGVAPTHCEGNNPPTCDFRAPPVGEAPYKHDQVGRALSVGVRLALTPRVFVRTEFAGYAGLIQKASVTGAWQF